MSWELTNDRPIYLQLSDHLKLQILSGKYQCGDHFPSVRELAAEAAVNPNTMQRALSSLEQEGLLIGSRTAGRTVTTEESLIRDMKENMALQLLADFRSSLEKLGFTDEEICGFIMKNYS